MPAHCSWGAIPRLPSRTTSRGRITSCRPGDGAVFSALSIHDYTKISNIVYYTKEELSKVKDHLIRLASIEGFDARQIRPKQVHMKKDAAPRQASLHRATKETDIRVEWTLDGSGESKIDTGIRFRPHAGVDGQAWIF